MEGCLHCTCLLRIISCITNAHMYCQIHFIVLKSNVDLPYYFNRSSDDDTYAGTCNPTNQR